MRKIAVIIACIAMCIFAICFIIFIRKQSEKRDIEKSLSSLGVESSNNKKKHKALIIEKQLAKTLKIDDNLFGTFLIAERIIIIAVCVILGFMIGYVAVAIIACLIIYFVMDNSVKKKIDDSGITRISETVAFMDYFTPTIASGSSASQAFNSYISKLDEDSRMYQLLTEYWDNKITNNVYYVKPNEIKDITSVYEIAQYNEEKGVDDYLYIIEEAKKDLFQKNSYYTSFNSKIKEAIVPTSAAYYAGVPAIILLLFESFGSFWFTIYGLLVAVVLIIIFAIFQFLLNKLTTNVVEEIL